MKDLKKLGLELTKTNWPDIFVWPLILTLILPLEVGPLYILLPDFAGNIIWHKVKNSVTYFQSLPLQVPGFF